MGTWFYGIVYYGKNFDEANSVIESFDQNEAKFITSTIEC